MGNSWKVCQITTAHSFEDVRIFYKECSALVESGMEVTLLGPDEEKMGSVSGVWLAGAGKKERGRMSRMIWTTRAVYRKALAINADIYHFHDPEFLPFARKLARRGKTVIYDVHEDVPVQILSKEWLPFWLRKPISVLFDWYEKKVAGELAGVVTATDHIRGLFVPYNSRTVAIRNYPQLQALPNPRPFSEKENAICYIGSISRNRGIVELVKSLEDLDLELELAGPFQPEEFRGELRKMKGWKKVRERGRLGRDGVKGVLSRSKVGMVTLLPIQNYLEALPVKMFEYMAAGLPVIVSDFPLWKGIVEKYSCGICVDPNDPVAITEAISSLLALPEEQLEEMGQRGRKAVEAELNWEKEKEGLIRFYSTLGE